MVFPFSEFRVTTSPKSFPDPNTIFVDLPDPLKWNGLDLTAKTPHLKKWLASPKLTS